MFTIQERVSRSQITPELLKEVERINTRAFFGVPSTRALYSKTLELLNNTDGPAFFIWHQKTEKKSLVGYVVTEYKFELGMEVSWKLHVCFLAIDPIRQYRRKGFGTLLMQKVFEVAKRNNIIVNLNYDSLSEPLHLFYSRFRPINPDSRLAINRFLNLTYLQPEFDPATSLRAIEEENSQKTNRLRVTEVKIAGPVLRGMREAEASQASSCCCSLL
jgi:GNAT superfamily N-acetyltransferase